jgi:hypothetical protein
VGAVNVDTLYLVGGTAKYLGQPLKKVFRQKFPWLQIVENWPPLPTTFVSDGDPYGRFLDVYGEYLMLNKQTFDF